MSRLRRCSKRATGFSLVELLIVMAIVGLLIAILMSVLSRARRAAIVLVSPVAYLGADNRVHLTTQTGSTDLEVGTASTVSCHVCHVAPTWDPSGLRLATQIQSGSGLTTLLASPASTEVTRNDEGNHLFIGWLDGDRYLASDDPMVSGMGKLQMHVRSVDGRELQTITNTKNSLVAVAPTPPGTAAPYIGATFDGSSSSVVLIGKNLMPGRNIWRFRASVGTAAQQPRIDPLGNYVGWSSGSTVNFKAVNAPPQTPPQVLGNPFTNSYFCDWTDGGDLLINTSSDNASWRLAVVTTSGRLVNYINTAVAPAAGATASYRKYQHR